ncbi:hypothetical protein CRM22_007144 [Opisthorchis felineus]|uniref:Reverse transcriptase domain-containing protein n=1 Tax=Opisthorchis felineus TaxID=147828 RepID=A0A4S2LP48_OPIFE|nr:hypothetical protein CRM22_007144 [Opisthorchis felineus]
MYAVSLRNSAQNSQRFSNDAIVNPCVDDILLASPSEQEHEAHLTALFECLAHHHAMSGRLPSSSSDTVWTNMSENKFQAIRDLPPPTIPAGVYHYRRFVPDCATLVRPPTDLLRGQTKGEGEFQLKA